MKLANIKNSQRRQTIGGISPCVTDLEFNWNKIECTLAFHNIMVNQYRIFSSDVNNMAAEAVDRELVLNSLLCFVLSKHTKIPKKCMISTLSDFYTASDLVAAKNQLLKDTEKAGLSEILPRYPVRQGGNQADQVINDIVDILARLDEQKKIDDLPRYVCCNSESIPSIKLDDGDLRFLINKIDKMEAVIGDMHTSINAVYALLSSIEKKVIDSVKNNQMFQPPAVRQPLPRRTIAQVVRPPTGVPPCIDDVHAFPPLGKPSADVFGQLGARSKNSDWATRANLASATSTDSLDAEQPFKLTHHEYQRKRRRMRSQQLDIQELQANGSQKSTNPRVEARVEKQNRPVDTSSKISANPKRSTAEIKPAQQRNSRSRRVPLSVGKCVTSSSVTGAKPYKQVYCVDNVSLAIDAEQLTQFVLNLGVRVISCFEVNPRLTSWQRSHYNQPDHRTFRLCINKVDKEILLNPNTLPEDIYISKWFFKGTNQDNPTASDPSNVALHRPNIDVIIQASGNVHEAEVVGDGQSSAMLSSESLSHDPYENDNDSENTILMRDSSFAIKSAAIAASTPNSKYRDG